MEGALVPSEEVVHRLFDLRLDVVLQLLFGDALLLHQDLAQALPLLERLLLHGRREVLPRNHVVSDQEFSQSIRTIQHRSVNHPSLSEIDVSKVGAVRQAKTPRLHTHPE